MQVRKFFKDPIRHPNEYRPYRGTVEFFDEDGQLFRVVYDDGDLEDYSLSDLNEILYEYSSEGEISSCGGGGKKSDEKLAAVAAARQAQAEQRAARSLNRSSADGGSSTGSKRGRSGRESPGTKRAG